MVDSIEISELDLERYEIFTPEDQYFTPPTTVPIDRTNQSAYSKTVYPPRTLKEYNKLRKTILPIFPLRSSLVSMARQPTATVEEEIDLLLCNVPRQLLTLEQYQRRQMNTYIPAFELHQWDQLRNKKNYPSFMISLYTDIYIKLSAQWHIDIPILDCNLARLRECATQNGFHFSFDDLPIALEFFLQMDVDLFHLKTCSFRQGQPRMIIDSQGHQSLEGIFSIDEQFVEGRYGLTPCHQRNCLHCSNTSLPISPDPKQIHRFLRQYKAILNCPVTCTTSNIIYALTCVCGEKDYVAHTNLPFVDCLLYHRQENLRIIREFLIGDVNINLIHVGPKSDETKANDENWLYQHTTRCPVAMQLFLDRNPTYWCFVPVPKDRTLRDRTYSRPERLSPLAQISTRTRSAAAEGSNPRRSDTFALRLVDNIPKPGDDYMFTAEQINEQKLYFIYGKDCDPMNVHKLNFYNAAIVAVLPDHCSPTVKKFIQSLFITHAECDLNKYGRLIPQRLFHRYPTRGEWYRGLIRRPSSSILF